MSALDKYKTTTTGDTSETEDTSTSSDYDASLQAIKAGNYRDYFNQAIQNKNAADAARKYMRTTLANQGMSTQGYGASALTSIGNTQIGANASALQSYRDANDTDIASYNTSLVNSVVTPLTTAMGNNENFDIGAYMKSNGFLDDSGNWTAKWTGMDATVRQDIQNQIIAAASGSDTQLSAANSLFGVVSPNASVQSAATLDEIKALTSNGSYNGVSYGDTFEDEFDELSDMTDIKSGSVVQMRNSNGDKLYLSWDGKSWTVSTKADYDKAGSNKINIANYVQATSVENSELNRAAKKELGGDMTAWMNKVFEYDGKKWVFKKNASTGQYHWQQYVDEEGE